MQAVATLATLAVGAAVLALGGCGRPYRDAVEAIETARCEAIFACCPSGGSLVTARTVEDCITERMGSSDVQFRLSRDEGAISRGEARYDGSALQDCLDGIRAARASCRLPIDAVKEAPCDRLIAGAAKAGEPCGTCEAGLVCRSGTCRRLVAAGEACDFVNECRIGLYCDRATCATLKAGGDPNVDASNLCTVDAECLSGECGPATLTIVIDPGPPKQTMDVMVSACTVPDSTSICMSMVP